MGERLDGLLKKVAYTLQIGIEYIEGMIQDRTMQDAQLSPQLSETPVKTTKHSKLKTFQTLKKF